MEFIDEAKIYVKAGNGGNGCVSFRKEKNIEKGGPSGGDGGQGGDIIFQTNPHINTLLKFRFNKHFKAQNGQGGMGDNCTGKSGKSIIIDVPIGTQIYVDNSGVLLHDFIKAGESRTLLQGGAGGIGNTRFKSSTNQAPRQFTKGVIGEEMLLYLKLKILSDVGLIGLPNAGKSTFLAHTTNAKPKIADYPFTTLKPNLGVVYLDNHDFVIADIPGLIKGAHLGHGLGDQFLKHIERCRLLIHLIDASSDDIVQNYVDIRNELESYSDLLKNKPEIICLNKMDMLETEELQSKTLALQKLTSGQIYSISALDYSSMKPLLRKVMQLVKIEKQSKGQQPE